MVRCGAILAIAGYYYPALNDWQDATTPLHYFYLDQEGYYWAAGNGHCEQIKIINSDGSSTWYVCDGDIPIEAGAHLVTASPPCGNPGEDIWQIDRVQERNQTWEVRAAIRGEPERSLGLQAAIAKANDLSPTIKAAIAGNPSLEFGALAAIRGNPERSLKIRASVMGGPELALAINAAIAVDVDLTPKIQAAIQGNPTMEVGQKAAIKGDAERTFTISTLILKNREEAILLEMENVWPQECDLRSTPNWPSRVKDYRRDSLGA